MTTVPACDNHTASCTPATSAGASGRRARSCEGGVGHAPSMASGEQMRAFAAMQQAAREYVERRRGQPRTR